jgi:hypothetical protein
MPQLYKFLRTGLKSEYGNFSWEVGKWYKADGRIEICKAGFHASEMPLDALCYVKGEIIARVEVRGDHVVDSDKQCWAEMRILDARQWTKQSSVELAIQAAEAVIEVFEKSHPSDSRPRAAIEAAKAWLTSPTDATEAAARAAGRAAAHAAADADACSAAAAAGYAYAAAARTAYAAAARTAYAAAATGYAATGYAATGYAAAADTSDTLNDWMKSRFQTLERV